MIYSMTGFASSSQELSEGNLHLELRSVNHRFLEFQFRLPEEFRSFESQIREKISRQVSRGKIDCRVSYTPTTNQNNPLIINQHLVNQIIDLNNQLVHKIDHASAINVVDLLRFPGVMISQDIDVEKFTGELFKLLDSSLQDLNKTRIREGEKLKNFITDRVHQMKAVIEKVQPKLPEIIKAFEAKLAEKLINVLSENHEERIKLEVTLFAQKIDIAEEISRLKTHLDEVLRIVEKGGNNVGKRLDFLMQELNREANTMGAKSISIDLSQSAMELKVFIEQMREQVQNIE